MSDVTELNPVDGLPEWKGRKVIPEWRKRRVTKRARRFVMLEWGWAAKALCAVGTDRATRLLVVLSLHEKLQRTKRTHGWVELVHHDLVAVGLADGHLSRPITKLETLGLIGVQRRPGKRPLLRLIKP